MGASGITEQAGIAWLYLARIPLITRDGGSATYWVGEAFNLDPELVATEVRRPTFDALEDSGLVASIRRNPERAARMRSGRLVPVIV